MLNRPHLSENVDRWRFRMHEIGIPVVHQVSSSHQAADALLRLQSEDIDEAPKTLTVSSMQIAVTIYGGKPPNNEASEKRKFH